MDLNYRFKVWGPTGTFLRTILRDDMTMRSTGLWARIAPEGDGIEASLTARGSTTDGAGVLDAPNWGIPTLSAVQIEYDNLGTWSPLYYGQVRQGGNPRDVQGETYVLRSLLERLKYVTLRPDFYTPQQPANITVQQAIYDTIQSGQLGTPSLILYDGLKIPDLGFDAREIEDASQQTVYSLLERIQQDGLAVGVTVRMGVGPDRAFYCRPALTDTLYVTWADVARVEWRPPVAETPYTRVLWHVGMQPGGSINRPRQTPLTVLSERMPDDPYGVWVKSMSVGVGVPVWTPDTEGAQFEFYNNAGQVTPPPTGFNALTISDGESGQSVAQYIRIPGTYGSIRLIPPAGPHQRVVVSSGATAQAVGASGNVLAQLPLRLMSVDNFPPIPGSVSYRDEVGFVPGWASPPTMVRRQDSGFRGWALGVLDGAPDGTEAIIIPVAEFRAERIDTGVLDGLAKFHYEVPEMEPADLTLTSFMAVSNLPGAINFGSYARPVSAYEYRVSADDGLTISVITGPPGDPAGLAQASLIKARDQQATMNALTAQR